MDKTVTLISKSTFLQGDISAKTIIVEGSVAGNLKATSSILIKKDGRVEGNIQAPKIYFEKGGRHKGGIYLDDSEDILSQETNVEQLEYKSSDDVKTKDEKPKAQPVSDSPKNKLW